MILPYRKVIIRCQKRNLKRSQTVKRKGLKDSGKEVTLRAERSGPKVGRNVLLLKKAETCLRRIGFPTWPYSLCRQQQMDDSGQKIAELGDGDSTDRGSCWNHACSISGGMIVDLKTNSATNMVAGVAACGLTTWQCSTDAMFGVY